MDDQHQLAVRDLGHGIPVLIIHGWTMSGLVEAHDFEPIFTGQSRYRRIYVDLPGMGQTPIEKHKTLDSMLERVAAFIEQHVLPSSFLLIGSSCGAYFARALAYRYADAVDGLLLRVPVVEPFSPDRDVDDFKPAVSDTALLSLLPGAQREKLGDIAVQTPSYIDTLRHKFETVWIPAMASADEAALDPIRNDRQAYSLTAAMHTSQTPFLKPTLILTGRQDAVVGYRDAWSLMPCYPRATFVALDRADHGLPVDETDIFKALVNDWLRRVEEVQRTARPSKHMG